MTTTYVLLVNWNGHRDTIECLESLLRLEDDDWAAIIVDNGSVDGSTEAIRHWATALPQSYGGPVWAALPTARRREPSLYEPETAATPAPGRASITLIQAGANLGFAAATNLALRFAARDPDCRFLWVLNNDTVVRPDTLGRLRHHATLHPDHGIIGAALLYYHQPDTVQALGGWTWSRRALAGHIGAGLKVGALPDRTEVELKLAYVVGASMFVRREVFEAVGGMSERYFLYFEELDLAKRLPTGMRQGVCLEAIVYHKEGGTIGSSSTARPSDTGIYYRTASMLRYFWRHERRHFPMAVARFSWDVLRYVGRGDGAALGAAMFAARDVATGRLRRGRYGSDDFHNGRKRRR